MIHFTITAPTVALISCSSEEMQNLKKFLSYRNTSAYFLYQKHMSQKWLERKDPDYFKARANELREGINRTLIFNTPNGPATYPGILGYLPFVHTIHNNIAYPKFKPIPWAKKPDFEPYPYQTEAVEKLITQKHGHISYSTGLGKSYILQLLTRNMGLKTLIVTPSQSIFSELLVQFERLFGKSKVGGLGDGKRNFKAPITIAISKSIAMLKEGTPEYNFIASKEMVAFDESHTLSAETLENAAHGVLANIPYRFFVSATQVNNNGMQKLLNSIIGPLVASKTVKEGIEEGFLCPLKFKIIKTISPSTLNPKDPLDKKREHFLRNPNIADISAKIANASWNTKQESTLILVEELSQIKMLKDRLAVPFGYVHSGSKKDAEQAGLEVVDPQEVLERFNRGEIKVLIGTKSISTGTNIFATHNTINWAGGSSEIATFQGAMGRSTRKLEISKYKDFHKPKPYSLIYDFDVTNNTFLRQQLDTRVKYYRETGEEVVY